MYTTSAAHTYTPHFCVPMQPLACNYSCTGTHLLYRKATMHHHHAPRAHPLYQNIRSLDTGTTKLEQPLTADGLHR